MGERGKRERPVNEAEYEEMPSRIEAAFDRVRELLPTAEDDE